MKRKLVFGIACACVIIVASVMLIASSTALGTSKSPKDILQAASAKAASTERYDIKYNMITSISAGNENLDFNGTMRITRTPDAERMMLHMGTFGTSASYDVYKLANGTFRCSTSLSGTICEQFNETPAIQNPVDQAAQLSALSEQGSASMKTSASKTIAGMQTDCVILNYDLSTFASGSALLQGVASEIKSASTEVCFDLETGLPLLNEMTIAMEIGKQSGTAKVSMAATSISLSAQDVSLPSGATIY